jgi:hypothetical protein
LVVLEREADDLIVRRLGRRDDDELVLRRPLDDPLIRVRVRGVRVLGEWRVGFEGLAGEVRLQRRGLGQLAQHLRVPGRDADRAGEAEPLEVVQRREDLIVRDHPAADHGDFEGLWHWRSGPLSRYSGRGLG